MDYKISPIFKYIILFIIIFLFIKHLNVLSFRNNIVCSTFAVITFVILDYMMIYDHPNLFEIKSSSKKQNDDDTTTENNEDIDTIIDTLDDE